MCDQLINKRSVENYLHLIIFMDYLLRNQIEQQSFIDIYFYFFRNVDGDDDNVRT